MNLQYILAGYFLLMLVSLGVSVIIHRGNPNVSTLNGIYFWLSLIVNFFIQGLVGENLPLQSLAMALVAPTGFVLVRMQEDLFGIRYSRKLFFFPLMASLVLATILFLMGFSFPVYTFGISFAVALPFFVFPFRIFRLGLSRTGSATCFLISIIVSGIHLMDYPFLRYTADGALLGFMGAFFTGFLMAILVPIVIVENITASYMARLEADVEKATQDLREANGQLLESQKENVNLVRILCHDINNSLFVARSAVSTMQRFFDQYFPERKSSDDEFVKQSLMAEKALSNQADLISNVNMMQKVISKKMVMRFGQVNLFEGVAASLSLLQMQATKKGLDFEIEIDPSLHINADKNMLVNCVFNNIFSNAIKFSLPGQKIRVCSKETEKFILLMIEDNGVGMSQKKLSEIFAVEGYTSSKGTSGEMGSGFGMPIAKNVIEKMSGEISLESYEKELHPDKHGTKVTLKFPV